MEKFKKLQEAMPREAEQRTFKTETRKGYDTSGYGYQFCVNRFNEVYEENWGFSYSLLKEVNGKYNNGTPYFDITVEVSIWVVSKEQARACVGGHISVLYTDALKGAITNAFKKTAAFWGVGRQAYEGTMDDDNLPLPKEHNETTYEVPFKSNYNKTTANLNDLPKTNTNTLTEKENAPDSEKIADLVISDDISEVDYCTFGKNKGKAWIEMSKETQLWYLNHLIEKPKKTDEHLGSIKTLQKLLQLGLNNMPRGSKI